MLLYLFHQISGIYVLIIITYPACNKLLLANVFYSHFKLHKKMFTFQEYIEDTMSFVKNSPKIHNIVLSQNPSKVLVIVEWRNRYYPEFDHVDISIGSSQKEAKKNIAFLSSSEINQFEMQPQNCIRILINKEGVYKKYTPELVANMFGVSKDLLPNL